MIVGDGTSLTRMTGLPATSELWAVVTSRSVPATGLESGTSPGQIFISVSPGAGFQVFSWAAAKLTRLVAAQKTKSALDMVATF